MIEIIGKNGSGKTFIANELSKRGFDKVVGYTTRDMREKEIDKVDYNFVSKQLFENMLSNNQFIDYKIRNGNYYGIRKKDITNNSIIISGNSDTIASLTGYQVYKIYLDTNLKNRYKRMVMRSSEDNLFDRIHLENFSFLNGFDALFIENNQVNLSVVDYISTVIDNGAISKDKLMNNTIFIQEKVKQYKFDNQKILKGIIDVLEYEEYIMRKISLMMNVDNRIMYYKLMKEFLDTLKFQYEEDSENIFVHANRKIYNLKYEER